MTWLDLFYHELQCLVSPWSLKVLCIYVLRSHKGLARYHFVISCYDCFEKVLSSEFYHYRSLADYAIDMSNCETEVLLWVWLVHNICWNLNAGFACLQQQEQTEFVKVLLYHFQSINRIAWGSWYVSNVSTFPNTFALVLDSNLHDLNETNRTDAVFSRITMMLFHV